jgi:photosystem II stability/assembly factor-like uncharacterized protein
MAAVPGGTMDFLVLGDGDPATVLAASNNNGLFVATTGTDPVFTKSNDPELAPHFYATPVLQTTPLERMVVGSSNQVLVSTDGGATFERLMTLPDLVTGLAVREGRVMVTAANRWIWTMSEQDPHIVEYVNQVPPLPPGAAPGVHGDGHLFVAIVTDDTWVVGIQGEGVYTTTNQGADFSLALLAPVLHDSFAVQGQQVVVSATDQTWASSNGGLTWAPLTAAPAHCRDASWTGAGLAQVCDGDLYFRQDGSESFTVLDLDRPVASVAL